MDIKKIFGANVKKYRKLSGLTQMQLAELVDVDQKHVSFIESGNSFPSPALMAQIAEKLKVLPKKLFEFEEPLNSEQIKEQIIFIVNNLEKDELARVHNFASSIYIDKNKNF